MNTEKTNFDKAASTWDKPERIKLANDIVAAVKKEVMLTQDMKVLDFGCGTGLITLGLQPLVRSITGVDSSRGMLDLLKSKISRGNLGNVTTQYIDIEKGDTLSGSYQLVVCGMTFHHVPDPKVLLEMFYKVTAPGGYICIADLDSDDGEFHPDNTSVFYCGFDRITLMEIFADVGLKNVRTVTAGEMTKPTSKDNMRTFPVFLMHGKK